MKIKTIKNNIKVKNLLIKFKKKTTKQEANKNNQ